MTKVPLNPNPLNPPFPFPLFGRLAAFHRQQIPGRRNGPGPGATFPESFRPQERRPDPAPAAADPRPRPRPESRREYGNTRIKHRQEPVRKNFIPRRGITGHPEKFFEKRA